MAPSSVLQCGIADRPGGVGLTTIGPSRPAAIVTAAERDGLDVRMRYDGFS
jgi:hypothetical protein